MQGELSEYADGVRGHVRMHANISAIVQFLPEDLGAFTREHEPDQDRPEEHLSPDVMQAVAKAPPISASAMRANSSAGTPLQTLPYREDRLVLVVPRPAPAGRPRLRAASPTCWTTTSWACMPAASAGRPAQQAAAAAGRALKLRIQVTSLDAMCRMIDNGLGVGLLPDRAFRLMQGVGQLRPSP
jgi:DNA-binding transcriptional LysR family regulator